jgi:hypothetical protein
MHEVLDYADCLKLFVRQFVGIPIPRTCDTELLYRIGESMLPRRETGSCRSLRELAVLRLYVASILMVSIANLGSQSR